MLDWTSYLKNGHLLHKVHRWMLILKLLKLILYCKIPRKNTCLNKHQPCSFARFLIFRKNRNKEETCNARDIVRLFVRSQCSNLSYHLFMISCNTFSYLPNELEFFGTHIITGVAVWMCATNCTLPNGPVPIHSVSSLSCSGIYGITLILQSSIMIWFMLSPTSNYSRWTKHPCVAIAHATQVNMPCQASWYGFSMESQIRVLIYPSRQQSCYFAIDRTRAHSLYHQNLHWIIAGHYVGVLWYSFNLVKMSQWIHLAKSMFCKRMTYMTQHSSSKLSFPKSLTA